MTEAFRIAMAHTFSPSHRMPGICARCDKPGSDYIHHVPDPLTLMSCREAGCEAEARGWFMVLDTSDEEHAEFATWVKDRSGRRFFEWVAPYAVEEALRREASGDLTVTPELRAMLESLAPGMAVFAFPAGQTCFKAHTDREVVFTHNRYVHANGRDYNEDMNETAYRLGKLRQVG